ncbi:hypothetical protein THAOC_00963, partial [Thalassiosira oceanica]
MKRRYLLLTSAASKQKVMSKKAIKRSNPRIERGTSSTLKTNHTTRP